jgi:hypothetical protein
MEEARFSTNFRMYLGKKDVQHTVRTDEDPRLHLELVTQFVEQCAVHGFQDEPSNGKPREGEKSFPLEGYIVGHATNKKGEREFCVWLYGMGEWKTATVYSRHWEKLGFIPDTSKILAQEEAPKTAAAKAKPEFIKLENARVIMEEYENFQGEKKIGFGRVAFGSSTPPAAAPPVTSVASGSAELADKIIAAVQTSATTPKLLVDYAAKAALKRPELGTEWPRIQTVFRSKCVAIRHMNTTEAMVDTVTKLRSVLGETNYKDLMDSLEPPAMPDDEVPF